MKYRLKDGKIVLIRKAREEDAREILDFMKKVTSESEFLLTEPDEIDYNVNKEKRIIKVYGNSANSVFLVAELEGKIVGVLNFKGGSRRCTRHKGEFGISVLKKYWGIGIGSALLNALIIWARKTGIKKIQLEVLENNTRAINLYMKHGFEIEGKKKKAVLKKGKYVDLLIMGRWLD